jgi:hypothetical protein
MAYVYSMAAHHVSSTRRRFVAAGLASGLSRFAAAAPAAEPSTRLFVDDRFVTRKKGVRRVVRSATKPDAPVITGERPWEGVRVYHAGSVIRDPATRRFRMWYMSRLDSGHSHQIPALTGRLPDLMLYAESEDGLKWRKPELGLIEFDGSRRNNIVACSTHSPGVLQTGAGFRMAAWNWTRNGYYGGSSADGLSWKFPDGVIYQPQNQTLEIITISQEPRTKKYFAFIRLWKEVRGYRRRILGMTSSDDFSTWEQPREILAPDEEDDRWVKNPEERTEFYGMAGFPYADQFLGFVPLFRVHRYQRRGSPEASLVADQSPWDGPIEAQLVHSRDGRTWSRCEDRSPVIPRSAAGSFDAGCILHVGNPPLVVGDEVWVYYSAINTTHGGSPVEKRITVGRASWPIDRFVALAAEHSGVVETMPPRGRHLSVNVDASRGQVQVEVLGADGAALPGYARADSTPISGDTLRAPVGWRGRQELPAVDGLRLRFWLDTASLYAYYMA